MGRLAGALYNGLWYVGWSIVRVPYLERLWGKVENFYHAACNARFRPSFY